MPRPSAFSLPRAVMDEKGAGSSGFSSAATRCFDQPSAFRRALEVTRGRTAGLNVSATGTVIAHATVPTAENERSITKGEFGGSAARVGGEMQDMACSILSVRE